MVAIGARVAAAWAASASAPAASKDRLGARGGGGGRWWQVVVAAVVVVDVAMDAVYRNYLM